MQRSKVQAQMFARLLGGTLCVLATFATGVTAYGQAAYSTNFDNFTTETLSGQPVGVSPNWDTNDADNGVTTAPNTTTTSGFKSIGQSDYVGFLTGYSTSAADKWGVLGGLQHSSAGAGGTTGVLPGASTVYLFNNFTLNSPSVYGLNVDFAIPQSTASAPANDSFAWTFRNGTTNLFSVDFAPVSTNANGTVNFAMRYTVNGSAQATTGNGIISSSVYHLTVNVNVPSKSFTISLLPTNGAAAFTTGAISLGSMDPSTVTNIAATWTLADTSSRLNGGYQNAGSNALIFDNYTINVPEPSTWALTGLAAVGLSTLAYRRRVRA